MPRNDELSEFLRRSRARVSPDDAGLPEWGVTRRVPGLRREEVARLANVSTDYYTRLEQGRQINPSSGVLQSIADALQLDHAERAHLFDLVRPKDAPTRRTPHRDVQRVRPALRRLLDSFSDHAGFVVGRRTDILAVNHLARALLTDFDAKPHRERNLTRWILLAPEARALYVEWDKVADEMIAALRLDAGRRPDDTTTAELVGELAMKSADFRRRWADHRVFDRTYGTKHLRHPVVGELSIDYQALALPNEPDQTLYLYLPSTDQASGDAWQLLTSWHADGPGAGQARRIDRHPQTRT